MEIRPFRVAIAQESLDDLGSRLDRIRWTSDIPGEGPDYGMSLAWVQRLAGYWRDGFDWRAAETRLNAFPQFITEIDGQDIYFLHVRSPEPDALPLILTHGWPGSVVEYLDVIGPLTDPRAHDRDPSIAFDLVIPSLPGFAFSSPLTGRGWGTTRTAAAWVQLMRRLGYQRYGAAGNDAGSMVSPEVGRLDPDHVTGVHVTQVFSFPSGDPAEFDGLSEQEMAALQKLQWFMDHKFSFNQLHSQQPQTLAHALADSPAGLLAWNGQLMGEDATGEKAPARRLHPGQRRAVLAHQHRRLVDPLLPRGCGGSSRAGADDRAARRGRLRRRLLRRPALRRAGSPEPGAVDHATRAPRSLRRPPGAGRAGRRHPRLLRRAPLNYPASVGDLLAEAEAELYADDPDGFTARRAELAERARDAGEPAVAKKITALRKPTRSAWVVNRLVRVDPGVRSRLDDLAADLREASDGGRLRELTAARAKLVDELTRTALEGVAAPPAALREEVTATFDAAIADPEVAASLGTLVRAAQYAGFGGFASPPSAPAPRKTKAPAEPAVEREARRQEKIKEAERAVADAEDRKSVV